MNLTDDNIETLLDPENEAERNGVDFDELGRDSKKWVKTLHAQIDRELRLATIDAKKASDAFWVANRTARAEASEDEQSRFGTRVRLRANTIQADWYQNRFVRSPIPSQKSKVFSRHISKGKEATRYAARHFSKGPAWEQDVIDAIEDRYEVARKRSQTLTKMRRVLNQYEGLLRELYK